MNLVRAQGSRLDQFFDLGDGHAARQDGKGVAAAGGLVEDEVAVPASASGPYQCEVAGDCFLDDEGAVPKARVSFADEAMTMLPSAWWRLGMPPSASGVPTPAWV